MEESNKYQIINNENINLLNINPKINPNNKNITNANKLSQIKIPKFSDILSISSNPEEIFTLLYPIGHGGFGTVYKAIHNETKTVFAIKIINFINSSKNKSLNPPQMNNIQNYFLNYNNYSLAQQESSLLKLCHQSKYIVNYYGSYYSKKSNTLWLILEYCTPGSLIDLMLAMNRTYTEEEIATIMKHVLKALILIHSKNLIHRDIKGANIFLSLDGYAKLGDFGVGIKLEKDILFRNSKKGSPYWMSPQVVKNLNYDMKTDIWSLGITCCEMCNGEPPYAEMNPQNVMEKIGKIPPKVDELINREKHSEEFYDFVGKCLQIEPEKRPNAKELIKHDFIVKYSKDNEFLKELVNEHIDDINKFRKISNIMNKQNIIYKNNNYIENKEDFHHKKNNESNITSHFNDDIKANNFQEKENLLIKMISSSSNIDNNGINSTKDSQNQKNEDKIIISPEKDFKNYPTFHKNEEDNNIKDNDDDSLEIKEIHDLCKSFDKNYNYFFKETKSLNKESNIKKYSKFNNNMNKKGIRNKLVKKDKNFGNKINLLLDMSEHIKENKLEDKSNHDRTKINIIYQKKKRNKSFDNIATNKNKNIINKSLDNLYSRNKSIKNFINNNTTSYVYVKARIKNKNKNKTKFIFKKPILSLNYKNNKYSINNKNIITEKYLIDKEDEEGHINNTNLFNTKSNFDILKNNKDNFAKTNYCFYKNIIALNEIKIFKFDILDNSNRLEKND